MGTVAPLQAVNSNEVKDGIGVGRGDFPHLSHSRCSKNIAKLQPKVENDSETWKLGANVGTRGKW